MAIKLEVRSKGEGGFRRGGRFFGPDPIEVELEDAQAEAIMREKQLFVRRLDGGPMPTDETDKNAPIASGLGEGSKPVPSDKTDGRPVQATTTTSAQRPAAPIVEGSTTTQENDDTNKRRSR